MSRGHTLAARFEVWNDDTGEHLRVGEDADGLLTEIAYISEKGAKGAAVSFPDEAIPKIIEALQARAEWLSCNPNG